METKREIQAENELLYEALGAIYDVAQDDEAEDPLEEISDLAAEALGFEETETVERS